MKFELDTNRITFIRYMLSSGKTVEFTLEDGILTDLDIVVETDEKPVMNANDNDEVNKIREIISMDKELDKYAEKYRDTIAKRTFGKPEVSTSDFTRYDTVRPSVLCETMGKQMKALKEWKEKIESDPEKMKAVQENK